MTKSGMFREQVAPVPPKYHRQQGMNWPSRVSPKKGTKFLQLFVPTKTYHNTSFCPLSRRIKSIFYNFFSPPFHGCLEYNLNVNPLADRNHLDKKRYHQPKGYISLSVYKKIHSTCFPTPNQMFKNILLLFYYFSCVITGRLGIKVQ